MTNPETGRNIVLATGLKSGQIAQLLAATSIVTGGGEGLRSSSPTRLPRSGNQMDDITYIYVIGQECGPVKVGISTKPWSRALTIGTSSPFRVQLLYCHPFSSREEARQFERSFHDVYCDYRMSGEWFKLSADLAIEGVQTAVDIDNHFHEMEALERRREMQEAREATRQ